MALPLSLQRAQVAYVSGDWPEAIACFRATTSCGDAIAEAHAWHGLSVIHSNPDICAARGVARDTVAAGEYAIILSCTRLLSVNPESSPTEQPRLLLCVVKSCSDVVKDRGVDRQSQYWLSGLRTLRAVVTACEKSPSAVDAASAVLAHNALGWAATCDDDVDRAARHYRRILAVSQRIGTLSDEEAQRVVMLAETNLAMLEAKTEEDFERAQALKQQLPTHGPPYISETGSTRATQRPACSACGAQPLTLKVCSGTCGGAARYCDATCFAAHIRQHMRESGCKKRKK